MNKLKVIVCFFAPMKFEQIFRATRFLVEIKHQFTQIFE